MEDKLIRKFFKRRMHDKSTLAYILDTFLLCCLVTIIFYAFLMSQVNISLLSWILAICAGLMFLLAYTMYQSIRLDRFIVKESSLLQKKALLEHLLLIDDESVYGLIERENGEFVKIFRAYPDEPVQAGEVIAAYHEATGGGYNKIQLYTTSRFSPQATSVAKKFAVEYALHPCDELIALAEKADLLPKKEVVEQAVKDDLLSRHSKKKRLSSFIIARPRSYVYCALIILAATFVTGYRIYYPLAAALCVSMAVISHKFGKAPRQQASEH